MSRVFVTGATGVLGRRVVPALLEAGHSVSAVARTGAKADRLRHDGAQPVRVDLFDADAVQTAIVGHDAICHFATHIPTGASMVRKRQWRTNDRLRRDAADILSTSAIAAGVERYVGESLTFGYVDRGDCWIDEQTPTDLSWSDESTRDAEAAAGAVTSAGGNGVSLRFGMLHASDSDHLDTYRRVARLGVSPLFGRPEGHTSFIDIKDAASAVVVALDAEPGVYNVAEASPATKEQHAAALADVVRRDRLRFVPSWLAGIAGDNMCRSHRIASNKLTEATGWQPSVNPIDHWSDAC